MAPDKNASTRPPLRRSPTGSPRALRLGMAAVAVGALLVSGGCGAAETAQQKYEQVAGNVAASAAAQVEGLLDRAMSGLPEAQAQISEQNRSTFVDVRTELE